MGTISLLVATASAENEAANPAEAHDGFLERDTLLPDLGGDRAKLADHGVAFGLNYTGEVFGNPTGGYRQGTVYNGLVSAELQIDFGKLAGWNGLTFQALAYETHGPSGTNRFTRDLNVYSSIDAYDSVRLFELWLEQSFFDNVVNLRVGQLAADSEFATTVGGALFLHSNFGALPILTIDVPTPNYPEAAPGVRLRLNTPDTRLYFQGAIFAGAPNADRDGDPDPSFRRGTAYNDDGIRFPISGNQGALLIGEAGYLLNHAKDAPGLPGAYRIGGYYHTGNFSDDRLDNTGRSLADPLSDHVPAAHRGDGGVYAAAEQVVFRGANATGQEDVSSSAAAPIGNAEDSPVAATGAPSPQGELLRIFGRTGAAPGNRNLVDFYAEGGLTYRSLFPTRDTDVVGLGFTYTAISPERRSRVRDSNRFDGTHVALPDYEDVLELTYQANISPWLSLQPDLQYIIHPGGSGRYGDALVLGTRTVITF